jgi:glycosyltransferase involved in cell wall biosynthesis
VKDYLSCGLPVVITPVPEVATNIAEWNAGIVIEYRVEALIEAVCSLIEDPQRYAAARQRATELGQRFDWNRILADALAEVEAGR